MKYIIFIAVLIVAAVIYKVLTRKRVMSPEQFAEAVRQRIISNHPDVGIKSTEGFDWTLEINGEPQQVFLHNTYARYCHYPNYFDELIDGFIRSVSTMEDTADLSWEDAKSRLLPSVKPPQYIEDSRQLPGGAAIVDNMVVLDYHHGLKILIAIDSEMSMSFATLSNLKNWGVTKEELLKVSIENLSKLTAPHWVEANEKAQQHGFFAFATHDGYDASRILLPDFYERASRALGCEKLLVGIPNRDFISAIPENCPWKEDFCRQVRSDSESYDHPISPDVIALPL